jgi:hypothetical protein
MCVLRQRGISLYALWTTLRITWPCRYYNGPDNGQPFFMSREYLFYVAAALYARISIAAALAQSACLNFILHYNYFAMPLSPPRCAKSRRAGNALCIPRRKVQQYRCIKKLFLLDALIMILMGRVELSLCTRSLINVKSKSARADAKLK